MDLLRALLQNSSAGTQYPRPQPDNIHREPSPDNEVHNSPTVDPLDALRAVQSNYHEDLSDEVRLIGGRTLDECRVDSAAALIAHPLPASYTRIPGISPPSHITLGPQSLSPTPVALSGPRTAENIKHLYHICQLRAVQPEFHFEKIGERHRVALRLGDVLVEDELGRTYGSKKEGKEVLAGKGLEIVKTWQMEEAKAIEDDASGVLESSGGANKTPETARAAQGKAVATWNQENWVGLLLEHSHSTSTSEPIYQPYQLTLHTFACTVTIAARPSEPFGSSSTAYASKRLAKAMAARAANLWLRAENRLGTSPARKKVKLENGAAIPTNVNGTVSNGTNSIASSMPSPSASVLDFVDSAGPSTFANQVHQLALMLGLTSPEYRLIAAPNTAMYSGAMYFKDGTGVLVGALGQVSGVYGKKAAKEECARGVVEVLREEVKRRQRLAGVVP